MGLLFFNLKTKERLFYNRKLLQFFAQGVYDLFKRIAFNLITFQLLLHDTQTLSTCGQCPQQHQYKEL